jgi:hypothetical protein
VSVLSITPKLTVSPDRIEARSADFARVLCLYAFDRRITIDRVGRRVIIDTQRLWFSRRRVTVSFDQVKRIVLRAGTMPGGGLLSIPPLSLLPGADAAFFVVSLAIDKSVDELALFTIWQEQEDGDDWLGSIVSDGTETVTLGDESSSKVITLLRQYLGVPVSSH